LPISRRLLANRRKILFALIVLVAFFIAAELIARWWLAGYAERRYGVDIEAYRDVGLVSDAGRGWKWEGEVLFRGPREVAPEKPSGIYRIITTGDSCAWGAMVDDEMTWSAVLEQALREIYGDDRVEVLNAGVVGYGPDQVTRLIEDKLRLFAPDLIVYYGTGGEAANWTRGKRKSLAPGLEGWRAWLFRSKFFLVLSHALRSRRPPPEPTSILQQSDRIRRMIAAASDAGAKLLLVEYPFVTPDGRLDSDIAGRGLRFDVPVVRTYKALTGIERPVRDIIFDHVHPTALGHALIGRRVAEEIKTQGWIEPAR